MTLLEEVNLEKLYAAGQVHVFSVLLTARAGSKYSAKSDACSITFSGRSIAKRPLPGGCWVMPTLFSAGITCLTRLLAFGLAPIRVKSVAPGAADTDLWAGMPAEQKEGFIRSQMEKMLTGQIWTAQDVAEAYLCLLKDGIATGSIVHSNSGALLCSCINA